MLAARAAGRDAKRRGPITAADAHAVAGMRAINKTMSENSVPSPHLGQIPRLEISVYWGRAAKIPDAYAKSSRTPRLGLGSWMQPVPPGVMPRGTSPGRRGEQPLARLSLLPVPAAREHHFLPSDRPPPLHGFFVGLLVFGIALPPYFTCRFSGGR